MTELKRIVKTIKEKLNKEFFIYAENSRPVGIPVCDKQFEGVTDDGNYTYFRFFYRNTGYIGVLEGVTEIEQNYALMLPSYIESFAEKEAYCEKMIRKIF